LTRYFAIYWAGKNVRCKALLRRGVFIRQGEKFVKRLFSLIYLGLMAYLEEYHAAIQLFCSTASSHVNGHSDVMDGGISVW
jgi:hypothetical protein